MFASLFKAGLLLTGVSGAALTTGIVPARVTSVGLQIVNSFPQVMPPPMAQPAAPIPVDPILSVIDQWKRLQQSDNWPFSGYANFLLAHPGWPGETSRRAAAETSIDTNSWSPSLAARFFDR